MENREREGAIISEEEFVERLHKFQQYNPTAVNKFKSTGRAERRGHLLKSGMIVANRPHHNRKNTCRRRGKSSRPDNELKKEMWQLIKEVARNGESE